MSSRTYEEAFPVDYRHQSTSIIKRTESESYQPCTESESFQPCTESESYLINRPVSKSYQLLIAHTESAKDARTGTGPTLKDRVYKVYAKMDACKRAKVIYDVKTAAGETFETNGVDMLNGDRYLDDEGNLLTYFRGIRFELKSNFKAPFIMFAKSVSSMK